MQSPGEQGSRELERRVKVSWREKESYTDGPTEPPFHALAAAVFLAIRPHSLRASSRMLTLDTGDYRENADGIK